MGTIRPQHWTVIGLVVGALVVGCSGSATMTPGASATRVASPAVATPRPAATPIVSSGPLSTATPTPGLDPALVGTWTGDIGGPIAPMRVAAATYSIGPCVVDGACGTWEYRGTLVDDPNVSLRDWPWVVPGKLVTCRGPLFFHGLVDAKSAFWGIQESFEGPDGGRCPDMYHCLALGADDTVEVFTGDVQRCARGSSGILHRADGSPAPAASE